MTESLPLSACVITLNEEDNIARCLRSVQWADDILVVDSGSEDRTIEIAEEHGARVIHNDWPGHKQQKQYATDHAEHDWIFSLDADEKVSEELAENVQSLFDEGSPEPQTSFEVNRLAKYMGRWIHHGCWHPDWIIRLFNRTETSWGGENPHDRVLPTDSVERLDGYLYHWPYESLSDQMDYINFYSSVAAREKHKKGETGGITRGIVHALGRLAKDFLLKFSWLDGKEGFIITLTNAYAKFLKYTKLLELNRGERSVETSYPKDESK